MKKFKPVRVKMPGKRVIRICVPQLLSNGVGFNCLGVIGSLLVSSMLSSLRNVLGKTIALKYLDKLGSRDDSFDTVVRCIDILSISSSHRKLLGLEEIILRINCTSGEHVVSQVDIGREYSRTIEVLERHLIETCKIRR